MAYEIQTNCPIVMLKVNVRENSFNVFQINYLLKFH